MQCNEAHSSWKEFAPSGANSFHEELTAFDMIGKIDMIIQNAESPLSALCHKTELNSTKVYATKADDDYIGKAAHMSCFC